MNKVRRAVLDDVQAFLEDARTLLLKTLDEEQAALDNLPESFQDGVQGVAMQDTIDAMQEAVDGVECVIDNVNSAKGE